MLLSAVQSLHFDFPSVTALLHEASLSAQCGGIVPTDGTAWCLLCLCHMRLLGQLILLDSDRQVACRMRIYPRG